MGKEIVQQATVPGTSVVIRVIRDTGPFGEGVLTDDDGYRWCAEQESGKVLATGTWSGYGSQGHQFEADARKVANEWWERTRQRVRELTAAAKQDADALAEEADREPEPPAPMTHPVTEAGIYFSGGTVYKVQRAVHGSGRFYAKRLEVTDGEGKFVYAPGAIRALRAEDKMTLEQAKEYGHVYGVCCKCGRTLTNEDSIAAGIGPICAGKGW